MTILHSERLRFEPMHANHYEGLRRMNSDPAVMRYITGQPETPEQTRAMIDKVQGRWAQLGYSWWCLFEQGGNEVIGACAVQNLNHDPSQEFELGWRLRPEFHGRGYAIEAARRMARFAFEDLNAPSLTAVCDPANTRSENVMIKLGMRRRGMETWYQRELLTYHMGRATWLALQQPLASTAPA